MRVERRGLEGDADRGSDLCALVVTSKPATRAVPEVGGSSVVSIKTVVDLPAPFGPRNP